MFKKIFIIFALLLLPLSPVLAVGSLKDASKNLQPTATGAGYQEGDLGNITGQIINTALQLVGIIFLGLMVYAGYLWMTAQGAEDQVEKAKKIITSAIIGLILTMSAYAITALITAKFSGPNAGSGPGGPSDPNACNECVIACQGGAACITACAERPECK